MQICSYVRLIIWLLFLRFIRCVSVLYFKSLDMCILYNTKFLRTFNFREWAEYAKIQCCENLLVLYHLYDQPK
jgi:hypothetical protein